MFIHKGPIDNNAAMVEIMAWRRIGDRPLSEPMLTRFTDAYICGTRGRWVNDTHIPAPSQPTSFASTKLKVGTLVSFVRLSICLSADRFVPASLDTYNFSDLLLLLSPSLYTILSGFILYVYIFATNPRKCVASFLSKTWNFTVYFYLPDEVHHVLASSGCQVIYGYFISIFWYPKQINKQFWHTNFTPFQTAVSLPNVHSGAFIIDWVSNSCMYIPIFPLIALAIHFANKIDIP